MKLATKKFIFSVGICALLGIATAAQAATIIKLNLGDIGPDVGMNGAGILRTIDDGDGSTAGDQNTAIEFTGFLNPIPDIVLNIASFSMHNLQAIGPASVAGTLVIQNFTGGTFELYNPADSLLLSGQLNNSALSGVLGPPGTGALFTTSFSNVTGGSLASSINPNSLSISMNMTNVNGGNGFVVAGGGPQLNPFLADAAVNIAGEVPEPTSLLLTVVGAAAAVAIGKRRRR